MDQRSCGPETLADGRASDVFVFGSQVPSAAMAAAAAQLLGDVCGTYSPVPKVVATL